VVLNPSFCGSVVRFTSFGVSAYPAHVQCISSAYPVHIQCRSSADPVQIQCISSAYPVHIQCISSAYPVHIQCISSAYPVHIQCISSAYPVLSGVCVSPSAGTWVDGNHNYFGFDHINRNAPVLIRTPKLTRFEPA
jgi:hypothetical protein